MITEDYCSKDLYKLLLEKGFDGEIRTTYDEDGYTKPSISLYVAMKWLRKVHNIFIEIYLPSHSEHEDTIYHGTYSFDIFNLNTKVYVYCTLNEKEFNSYEETVKAAIKYCLENLI